MSSKVNVPVFVFVGIAILTLSIMAFGTQEVAYDVLKALLFVYIISVVAYGLGMATGRIE